MRFFTIPIQDIGNAPGELNGFLSNHRILTIERHFVADGGNSAWAICVNCLDSPERVSGDKRGGGGRGEYREVLRVCSIRRYPMVLGRVARSVVTRHVRAWLGRDERPLTSGVSPID
jgi:hypothetical protein